MILLSILTAQHSVLAYLEKPLMILYVYVYLNDPKSIAITWIEET